MASSRSPASPAFLPPAGASARRQLRKRDDPRRRRRVHVEYGGIRRWSTRLAMTGTSRGERHLGELPVYLRLEVPGRRHARPGWLHPGDGPGWHRRAVHLPDGYAILRRTVRPDQPVRGLRHLPRDVRSHARTRRPTGWPSGTTSTGSCEAVSQSSDSEQPDGGAVRMAGRPGPHRRRRQRWIELRDAPGSGEFSEKCRCFHYFSRLQ